MIVLQCLFDVLHQVLQRFFRERTFFINHYKRGKFAVNKSSRIVLECIDGKVYCV